MDTKVWSASALFGTILGALLVLGSPAHAASLAVATTDVNLRAGPSTAYPAVDVVPYGDAVRVFGCLESRAWCDVSFAGRRGWMASHYIAFLDSGRRYVGVEALDVIEAPVITFSVGSYWDDHYRARSFYQERDRWAGRRWDDDRRYERRVVRREENTWEPDNNWRQDRGERRDGRRGYEREGAGDEFFGTDGGVETQYRRRRGWEGE